MKIKSIIAFGYLLLSQASILPGSDEVTCINPIIKTSNDYANRYLFGAIDEGNDTAVSNAIAHGVDINAKNINGHTPWELVKQYIKDKKSSYVEHGCQHYNSSVVSPMGFKIIQILTDAGFDTTPKLSSLRQDVSDGYEFQLQ